MAKTEADFRGDLIQRLFAVAISVGAASTIAAMPWVQRGEMPDLNAAQQLSILAAAMTATVLSWDGYLMAIQARPLTSVIRFAIDIFLVFVYMFLLLTSTHHTWWLFIHWFIFALYLVWDRITVSDYLPEYYETSYTGPKSVEGVYRGGFRDEPGVKKGPVITVGWFLYFLVLWLISKNGLDHRIFGTSVFAIAGLVLYRVDKKYRLKMWKRASCVVGLLVLSYAFVKFGPLDETVKNWVMWLSAGINT